MAGIVRLLGPATMAGAERYTGEPVTPGEAAARAGLLYDIEERPLHFTDRNGYTVQAHDQKALTRGDNGNYLGTVGQGYQVIDGAQQVAYVEEIARATDAGPSCVEACGNMADGVRQFWALKVGQETIQTPRGEDTLDLHAWISNSHGLSALSWQAGLVREACANMQIPKMETISRGSIRHTRGAVGAMADSVAVIARVKAYGQQFREMAQVMSQTRMSDQEAEQGFGRLFSRPPEGRRINPETGQPTRAETNHRRIMQQLLTNWHTGQGASLSRGTAWGFLQAVTEHTSHQTRTRGTSDAHGRRLESALFGSNTQQLHTQAIQVAAQLTGAA